MKKVFTILLTICLLCVFSSTTYAEEISEHNTKVASITTEITPYSIFTITQYSFSKDENIELLASVTFNDSNNQIGVISNVQLFSSTTGVKNITVGSPVNYGNYAYCTVAYQYNGKTYTSLCYFLPSFIEFVHSSNYNY